MHLPSGTARKVPDTAKIEVFDSSCKCVTESVDQCDMLTRSFADNTDLENSMKRRSLLAVVIVGVPIGIGVIAIGDNIRRWLTAPSPHELVTPHLLNARSKTEHAIENKLDPVRVFFDDSRKNTRKFAEVALGWGSKWQLLKDQVPFTKGGRHEEFIRSQFEEMIFSSNQLEEVVSNSVSEYLAEIRNIENQMLVDLRADIANYPDAYRLANLNDEEFKQKFDEAIGRAVSKTQSQVHKDVGRGLVSLVVAEVLQKVAIRMGVTSIILGGGAATSTASLGVTIIIGLMIDQIISLVWNWWADPTGNLASDLDKKLNEMRDLICDGDEEIKGLGQSFRSLSIERERIREIAIMDLLTRKDGSK